MPADVDILAKMIFDWFDRGDDPYTYSPLPEIFTIGADGEVDCRKLARALIETGVSVPVRPTDGGTDA